MALHQPSIIGSLIPELSGNQNLEDQMVDVTCIWMMWHVGLMLRGARFEIRNRTTDIAAGKLKDSGECAAWPRLPDDILSPSILAGEGSAMGSELVTLASTSTDGLAAEDILTGNDASGCLCFPAAAWGFPEPLTVCSLAGGLALLSFSNCLALACCANSLPL